MGRKVCTPTNLRSNLYVLGIAESGGGKDHARKAIKEILVQAGLSHHLGGERLGSGAGLITALVRQPAALFQIDEFGRFLANVVDKRRAPKYLSEIWDLFTELATSSATTFFGAEYADQIERPRQDIIQLRLRTRHQRAGAVLGRVERRFAGGWQPGAVPGVPQRGRYPRSESSRRRAVRFAG